MAKYHGMCERLWANCAVSTEHFWKGTPCWDWTGKTCGDRSGTLRYPLYTVRIKGVPKNRRAHRASLRVFAGVKFRKHHEANHLCCRTICINPMHLERVTRLRNEHYKRVFKRVWETQEQPPAHDPMDDIGTLVETEGDTIPF